MYLLDEEPVPIEAQWLALQHVHLHQLDVVALKCLLPQNSCHCLPKIIERVCSSSTVKG